jgi:hypothetical protein
VDQGRPPLKHGHTQVWLKSGRHLASVIERHDKQIGYSPFIHQQLRARFLLLKAALQAIPLNKLKLFGGIRLSLSTLERCNSSSAPVPCMAINHVALLPTEPALASTALLMPAQWRANAPAALQQLGPMRCKLLQVSGQFATFQTSLELDTQQALPCKESWTFGMQRL